MILHSDLLPHLKKEGLQVAVVIPNADEESMKSLAVRLGIEVFRPPRLAARYHSEYERFRRYVFEDVQLNPALRAKYLRDLHAPANRAWRRQQARMYASLGRRRPGSPRLQGVLRKVDNWHYSSREASNLLRKLKPSLLVSTYPVAGIEAIFLREAQRLGVTTVAQLLSWDNISCKGPFPVVPEYFLAWGSIMREEIQEYYGIPSDRISVCGAPHFDAHVMAPSSDLVGAKLGSLGLEVKNPYLFFGMSSPYFAPHEIDIVEWLADAVRKDLFGPSLQLLVRPHPQNISGNMADLSWLSRLETLKGERVGVDYPTLEKSQLRWNMAAEDLPRLAALLGGCSVSLNSGSTLSLDAITHDKPVILTSFDADYEVPWWKSARRGPEYLHMVKLIALGGVRLTQSYQELQAAIEAYLADPGLDAQGRSLTKNQECGPCDGLASQRAATALVNLVRHQCSAP